MIRQKKLLVLLLVVMLVAASVLACSAKKEEPAKEEPAETGTSEEPANEEPADDAKAGPAMADTVVIATADETPSLTTADHNAVAGDYINELTHNGLFRMNSDLEPVPDLVKEYKVEKDENGEETIWVMTLHEGIKFHDGSDLTSDDVIATLELSKTKPNIATYTKSFVKLEKVDDLTFKIYTDGPSAILLYNLCHHGNYILPKALIEAGNDFNTNPVGTGPYKFVEWKRSEYLKFEAFEDYFDKDRAAKIKNIVWKIIPEGSSRTIALETGEVDYIIELDSTTKQNVIDNANLELLETFSIGHNWLTVNNEVAPFDDIRVRKAINAAINKEDVLTVAVEGSGIVCTAQVPEGMTGWDPTGFGGYDLEEAKKLMADWGGDPASIKMSIICSNDTKRRAGEIIQANLLELGINAEIESMDLATYLSETAAGNFTAFIGGYSSSELMTFLKGVYHSENINASNKTRTANPELDALIDKATRTVDPAEREEILKETSRLLNENCYQMPLYQNSNLSACKVNLKGVGIAPDGSFSVCEWYWE